MLGANWRSRTQLELALFRVLHTEISRRNAAFDYVQSLLKCVRTRVIELAYLIRPIGLFYAYSLDSDLPAEYRILYRNLKMTHNITLAW